MTSAGGWGLVFTLQSGYARRWHYFRGGRSLCGRYWRFSDADLHDGMPTDACAACKLRREREREKEAREHEPIG